MADQSQAPAPAPGSPEHDAAMAAKYDAAQPKAPDQPESAKPAPPVRPEGIPDKFWDAERGEVRVAELAKSYAELERARAKPADQGSTPEQAPQGSPENPAAPLSAEQFDAYGREVAEKGDLSSESRAALIAKGIPEAVINAHVAGVKAAAAGFESKVYETVGGKDAYIAMAAWAASSLSEGEVAAFNAAVTSGSADYAVLAVQGLSARYHAANGIDPKAPLGGSSKGSASAGYASSAEMVRDMQHPHYATDPAYRARVEARLAVTTAF